MWFSEAWKLDIRHCDCRNEYVVYKIPFHHEKRTDKYNSTG